MNRCFRLDKSSFYEFFESMREYGTVFAPVRVSEQSFSFKEVATPEEIAFEALRTILPPKKFFYPQRETLLAYDREGIKECVPEEKRQVIFGVHPCDLAGLGVIDKIFTSGQPDAHYVKRKESTIIVGLSCMPDKHCFCKSMGTDSPTSGYDLFLTETGETYFVEVKTPSGMVLIESRRSLFSAVDADDRRRFKEFWLNRDQAFETSFNGSNLSAIVETEWDNPVWDELGQRCLSCGNCTPVCPTCYCFDITDITSMSGDSGERVREWDSCQFTGFAKVAGDYNFRPGPVDRLKFWYRHKLAGFDDPYGFPTCVGCGRCTVSCPAGIDDIVGVVLRLQGDQDNEKRD